MIGFLIEHYAGNFPVWLSPEQVRVIPITDGQNEYAQSIVQQLRDNGIRVSADISAQRMNAKIRAGANDEGAVHAGGWRERDESRSSFIACT